MKKIVFLVIICLILLISLNAQRAARPVDKSQTKSQSETETETSSDEPYYIFEDYFSDNENNWALKDNSDMMSKIEYGNLVFQHKPEESGYYIWNYTYLDGDYDFTISTKIKHVSGAENYGFGLTWGIDDVNNYFSFEITDNGYYRIARSTEDDWHEYVEWTESSYINTYGGSNILTVKKVGDKLNFYINDSYVNWIYYEDISSDGVGYVIWRNQKLEIDYLTVYGIEDWELWWDLFDW